MIRYRAVDELRADYPVVRLCRLMEVSRSGFYDWLTRPPSARELVDRQLLPVIIDIHIGSRWTYGAPRILGQMRLRGHMIGKHRVARLMRRADLIGVHGRKKGKRRKVDAAPAPDLLQRDFTAERPNQRWVADISEFKTGEGKLYVAGIRDLCHRGIVGWAMDDHHRAELVVDALTMALRRSTPDADGLIHHSDKGGEYLSNDLALAAGAVQKLTLSFGRTGDALDNAAMETVWGTMKREVDHIRGGVPFATRDEARAYLFEYIEVFYNRQRHQARLGHLTPADYAAQFVA